MMSKMLIKLALTAAIAILLPGSKAVYGETQRLQVAGTGKSPMRIIKDTIKQIIEINKEYEARDKEKREEHREKLREILNPHFDFQEMAKRSLGAQWLKISKEEQDEFVSVFSDLLASTYLGKIDSITEDIVKFDSEKIREPKAIVKTIVTHKGDEFPIDYKLLHRDNSWGVYDIVIENIGLVANYRNEFAGIIRKNKFSGLMEKLRKKSKNVKKSKDA